MTHIERVKRQPTERHSEPQQRIPANMTTTLPRRSSDWIDCETLRALLKTNLGLNSKQVSVSKRSGLQYLKITIRDAGVDVAKVREFAKSLNTWSMDQTDYVEGQSVDVLTTKEVDEIHAAPYLEEIRVAVFLCGENGWERLSTGAILHRHDRYFWVSKDSKRGSNYYASDVLNGHEYAFRGLALDMAHFGPAAA